MTKLENRLSTADEVVLKFVDKKKRSRNWIRDIMYKAYMDDKIHLLPSQDGVDYILRKLAKMKLIKTEKWEQVHSRVYWK